MGATVEKLRQAIASVEASRTALGVSSDRLIDLAWSVMILRPEQRIEILEAENARMREALQRITTCADWPRGNDVHGIADVARDVLKPFTQPQP